MFRWFNEAGFKADIAGLRRTYPEIHLQTLERMNITLPVRNNCLPKEEVLAFVEQHGVVLESARGPVPSLVGRSSATGRFLPYDPSILRARRLCISRRPSAIR
jgi:hypothetical protein